MRFRANAFVLLALPLSLAAQEPPLAQPASIPTDLAVALANAGGFGVSGDPQILVGTIPEWVVAKVKVPENWRVLGSAFAGTTFVGVLQVNTNSDSLIAEFDRLQTPLGWKVPPPPYEGVREGFQIVPASSPATRAQRPDRRITRCGDGQTLSAWVSRERSLSTTVVFRLASMPAPPQNSTCNPYMPPPEFRQPRARSPLLYNPAAVRETHDRSCARQYGPGESMTGTSTQYKLPTSPEQLMEHYARQLQDSGWMPQGTTQRSVSVKRNWTKPAASGAPLNLYLEITVPPQDTLCRDVSLMMSDRDRR